MIRGFPLVATAALGCAFSCLAEAPLPLGKVVFVGDSISSGVGVRDRANDRYSAVTARLLKAKHPEVVGVTMASSGRALCQMGPDYPQKVLAAEPDAVVIQWGVNDQYWGYSVTEFATRYNELVKALRTAKPKAPLVLTTLVADFRWPTNLDLWIGEANVAIQEIAARHRCRVAYVHRAFDHRKEFYADTIHPNEKGAEVMAKEIVAAFEAPPLSPENLALRFDQGRGVRFLRYVFAPHREGIEPSWIEVTEISPSGMRMETGVPVTLRTPAIYAKGTTYRVRILQEDGKEVDTYDLEAAWSRMLGFTVTPPRGKKTPLRIEIAPLAKP